MAIKINPLPPIEQIREQLTYDPHTGDITWLLTWGRCTGGSIAGWITATGYRRIKVCKSIHQAHRIAWALHYGTDPWPMEIDHINRNKLDNRICNLRAVTHHGNVINSTGRRRPVTITYPDGSVTMAPSVKHAQQQLNLSSTGIRKILLRDGILRTNRGSTHPSGITIAYT